MHLRLLLLSPVLLLAACFNDPEGGTGATATATVSATDNPGTGAWTGASTGDPGSSGDWPSSTSTGSTGHDHPVTTTTWPGTTSSTSSTTGGDDDPGCTMYCAAIMSSCPGEFAQYPSLDSCLGMCARLPPGAPGETGGNSLACRAYHAGMAISDPALHCVHAGPGGAGACGQNCDGFCAIATATCPLEHPSPDACAATCTAFADTEPYNTGDATGDTLACRLYHLGIAASSDADAEVHCPHTVLESPPCK